MGVAAGFGGGNVVLIREGRAYVPDPDADGATPYLHVVGEGYPETWVQGMEVYHNPNALPRSILNSFRARYITIS